MMKQRRMTKHKDEDSDKSYVDVNNPKCLNCHEKLRIVVNPIKHKCDGCGMVYTINPYTGEVKSKFKSYEKAKQNGKAMD